MSEAQMTYSEVVDSLFGFDEVNDCFRVRLPETEAHPARARAIGNIGGLNRVQFPPYVTAHREPGAVYVMVCEGSGYLAGFNPNEPDPKAALAAAIYADGTNVPEEWKEPIAKALEQIRERWPGHRLVFRPDSDGAL